MSDFYEIVGLVPDDEAVFDVAGAWAEVLPEVMPIHEIHDGWRGAAGAEIAAETYEPFPHPWDWTLAWCQLRAWHQAYSDGLAGSDDIVDFRELPVEELPGWIIHRALPYVAEHWGY